MLEFALIIFEYTTATILSNNLVPTFRYSEVCTLSLCFLYRGRGMRLFVSLEGMTPLL